MILTRSEIPASITTIEMLYVWCCIVLQAYNPQLRTKEAENYTDYACQVSTFTDADQLERFVGRVNVKLATGWQSNGLKIWANAQEFSTATLAANYKS